MPFAGGSGTSSDPYQIELWEHLDSVRSEPSAYYKLTTNLTDETSDYSTYGDGFEPLPLFSGTFDGNYKTISDLVITDDGRNCGLFRDITGVVENLFLDGTVTNTNDAGGTGLLAGRSSGELNNVGTHGSVTKESGGSLYFSSSSITTDTESGFGELDADDTPKTDVGGLFINRDTAATGGIVGKFGGTTGTYTHPIATADVTDQTDDSFTMVGGIGGRANGTFSSGYVTATITSNRNTGVGFGESEASITDIYWRSESGSTAVYTGDATGFTSLTESEMLGDSAATSMDQLDFSTPVWDTVGVDDPDTTTDWYPILLQYDRPSALTAVGVYQTPVVSLSAEPVEPTDTPVVANGTDSVSKSVSSASVTHSTFSPTAGLGESRSGVSAGTTTVTSSAVSAGLGSVSAPINLGAVSITSEPPAVGDATAQMPVQADAVTTTPFLFATSSSDESVLSITLTTLQMTTPAVGETTDHVSGLLSYDETGVTEFAIGQSAPVAVPVSAGTPTILTPAISNTTDEQAFALSLQTLTSTDAAVTLGSVTRPIPVTLVEAMTLTEMFDNTAVGIATSGVAVTTADSSASELPLAQAKRTSILSTLSTQTISTPPVTTTTDEERSQVSGQEATVSELALYRVSRLSYESFSTGMAETTDSPYIAHRPPSKSDGTDTPPRPAPVVLVNPSLDHEVSYDDVTEQARTLVAQMRETTKTPYNTG